MRKQEYKMKNLFLWVLVYTIILASSQVMIKMGLSNTSGLSLKEHKEFVPFIVSLIKSPLLILGVAMMASSFILWIYILSWFKLSVVFPLTAMTYIFVAFFAHFMLGETLALLNYCGVALIAGGMFFLLLK